MTVTSLAATKPVRGREWWPARYQDEVMPTEKATPAEWLMKRADGSWALLSWHWDDPELAGDEQEDARGDALVDGQKLEFVYCDRMEDIEVEIRPGGSFAILDGEVNPRATHFWIPFETLGSTLAEAAAAYAEDEKLTALEQVVVHTAFWGNATFLLDLSGPAPVLREAGNA